MKKVLVILIIFIAIPSLAYAGVDFTKVVADNAMLLLFLTSTIALFAAGIGKIIWSKMDMRLDQQTKKAEDKEDEIYRTEMKAKEQEISQLKMRLDRIEVEETVCQRNLPLTYVTRQEYDKFVLQHREEFSGLMTRMEGMIREFRNEIKTDMQDQMDRIVDLIGKLIDTKKKQS